MVDYKHVVPEPQTSPVKILTTTWHLPESWSLANYLSVGGYQSLPKALKMAPQAIVDEVVKSNLRGRGGAGFPTGMKWNFVRKETSFPKYLVVNADEGEPGTFKDRAILEWSPHMFVEGLIIGCFAIDCHLTYVYCRGEFRDGPVARLQTAIDEAYAKGSWSEHPGLGVRSRVHVVRGAAPISAAKRRRCSIIGRKQGYPRLKPPFPANAGGGLFKQPTAVNNVETLANMPAIIEKGGEWFSSVGCPKNGGTRLYAVSGHSKKTGVFEAPMGTTFKVLLEQYCGGMRDGATLKAIIPGGSSSAVMTAEEAEWMSDFDTLKAKKTMAGSGGVIFLDQSVNMAHCLANVTRFYAAESCGQCTPCREGCAWLSRLLDKLCRGEGEKKDVDNIHQIARQMEQKTICALADGAAMPIKSFIEKFRGDFDALVKG